MVRVLPDPPLFDGETSQYLDGTLKDYLWRDAEVRAMLFENLGRNNKRFGSAEPDVSLRQVGEMRDSNFEATWSYMVKRLSAYGGCLGGQRR